MDVGFELAPRLLYFGGTPGKGYWLDPPPGMPTLAPESSSELSVEPFSVIFRWTVFFAGFLAVGMNFIIPCCCGLCHNVSHDKSQFTVTDTVDITATTVLHTIVLHSLMETPAKTKQ